MELVYESLDEVMGQRFEREGTPYEKMGIGSERYTPLVKNFLQIIFNTVKLTEHKFLNTGEDFITDDKMLEGFRIFVNTWPKYEKLMEKTGVTFEKNWGDKPGLEETIFKILPGFEDQNYIH